MIQKQDPSQVHHPTPTQHHPVAWKISLRKPHDSEGAQSAPSSSGTNSKPEEAAESAGDEDKEESGAGIFSSPLPFILGGVCVAVLALAAMFQRMSCAEKDAPEAHSTRNAGSRRGSQRSVASVTKRGSVGISPHSHAHLR